MTNIKQKISAFALAVIAYFAQVTSTFAAFWIWPDVNIQGGLTTDFKTWVLTVVNYFLWFLWLLCVLLIVYAGVKMVISQWKEEEFKKAKDMIINSVIWVVVIILSYSIVQLATNVG